MVTYSKTYQAGNRLVECDICGFGYRFGQMRKQNGLIVCPEDYDEPNPRDNKVELRKKSKLPEVE